MNSVLSRIVSNTLVQDAEVCRTIIHIAFAFLISFKRTLRGLTQMSSGDDQRRALRSSPSLHRIVPELQIVSSKSLPSTPLHIYDLNRKSRNVQQYHSSEDSQDNESQFRHSHLLSSRRTECKASPQIRSAITNSRSSSLLLTNELKKKGQNSTSDLRSCQGSYISFMSISPLLLLMIILFLGKLA